MKCGAILSDTFVVDRDGCILKEWHTEPHTFIDDNGVKWHWETDLTCTCDHCMQCEGDYCTIYWRA